MKLTIGYMTENRRFGKAVRRARPRLSELIDNLKTIHFSDDRYKDVVLWLTDESSDYYREVDTSEDFISVYIGVGPTDRLERLDIGSLAAFIRDRIAFFVKQSNINESDLNRILEILNAL